MCPAGNSIFFSVKRIEDPIGLLPAKLILGINKVRSASHVSNVTPVDPDWVNTKL